jgi:CBS domain-containing protein
MVLTADCEHHHRVCQQPESMLAMTDTKGETLMQVCEIMHEHPVCAFADDNATKVAQLMREQDTGIIPVIQAGSGGKLLGVITDRDICLRIIAAGYDPATVRIRDFMTSDPVCCGPRDPVGYAMVLMREYRVRRIPVVDRENRIGGMLTFANLAGNVASAEELARLLGSVCTGPTAVAKGDLHLVTADFSR